MYQEKYMKSTACSIPPVMKGAAGQFQGRSIILYEREGDEGNSVTHNLGHEGNSVAHNLGGEGNSTTLRSLERE